VVKTRKESRKRATSSELVVSTGAGPGNTNSCAITADALGNPVLTPTGTGCSGFATVVVTDDSITIVHGTFTTSGTGPNANVWDIDLAFGTSNSPNTDPALDVSSVTATCVQACNNNAVEIWYSDIGFTTAVSGFTNAYSGTDEGSGSTSQSAWVSSTDTLLAKTSPIGTVGPLPNTGPTAASGGTVSGGGSAGPTAYSLTLEQLFISDAESDTFSVDGSITGNVSVPEPMSLLLLGGCLLVVGRKLAARLA